MTSKGFIIISLHVTWSFYAVNLDTDTVVLERAVGIAFHQTTKSWTLSCADDKMNVDQMMI